MENKDNEKSSYPPEYLHIELKVRALQERIKIIDKQIDNATGVSQYNLEYNPPGLNPPGTLNTKPATRFKEVKDLEQEKERDKADTFDGIDKILKRDKTPDAKKVRDIVLSEIYPNPHNSMNEKEFNAERKQLKDTERSQNYMDSLNIRAKKIKTEKSKEENLEKNIIKEEEIKPLSISMKFNQSLGYSKSLALEKTDKVRTRDKEERDKN